MKVPRRIIEKSLQGKGFEKHDGRDHRYYYFLYKGKKTIARTKVSTGTKYKDYGMDLLNMMKRDLFLELKDLKDLVICPMNEDQYARILLKKGKISS